MDLVIKFDHCASAATPLRGRHRFSCYAVLGLVGVLGVLAFIFSAVSPDDDEIQQEFIKGLKLDNVLSRIASRYRARVTFINPVHYAFVPRGLASFRCSVIERAHISEVRIGAHNYQQPDRRSFSFYQIIIQVPKFLGPGARKPSQVNRFWHRSGKHRLGERLHFAAI
jgi:hypothetical protein